MPKKLHDMKNAIKRENPEYSEEKAWKIAQAAYKKSQRKGRSKKHR